VQLHYTEATLNSVRILLEKRHIVQIFGQDTHKLTRKIVDTISLVLLNFTIFTGSIAFLK
jgi:hypothetical protein